MNTGKVLRKSTILLLLLATFGTIFTVPTAAQGAVDLVATASSTTVDVDDTFTVTIEVQSNGAQINIVEVYLGFDPAILEVTSLSTPGGDILDDFEPRSPIFDNVLGTIGYGAGLLGSTTSDSFEFLVITFQAKSSGETMIDFIDPNGPANTIVAGVGGNILGSANPVSITVEDDTPPANVAPVVAISASASSITLPANSITLDATATDGDGPNPLTFSWAVTDGTASNVNIANPTSEDTLVTFSAAGTYELTLTADDGLDTGEDTVVIQVNPEDAGNVPPLVDAGDDQTITLPANIVTLDATATDSDGPNPLTFSWAVTDGTASNVNIASPSSEDTVVTFSAAGTYELTLTADDGADSANDSVTVTVEEEDTTPELGEADLFINPATTNVTAGDTFTLTVQVQSGTQQLASVELYLEFDPGVLAVQSLQPITTELSNTLVGAGFDNGAGTIAYGVGVGLGQNVVFPSGTFDILEIEFTAVAPGTTSIEFYDPTGVPSTIIAFEGVNILGDANSASVTVEETQQNINPVADAGADEQVTDSDGNGTEEVTLDGTGSTDSDGTIVSYSWSLNNIQIATGSNPTVTLPVGENVITLTVTDDANATDTDEVTITVAPQPQEDDVFLVISPETTTTSVGAQFDVVVMVETGTQQIDAAEVHLDFDTNVLEVVSTTPGTTLQTVLVDDFDNDAGTIDYAGGFLPSGTPGVFPSGSFALVTITFEALQETDETGTLLTYAPLVFPRESIVTFAGNNVLTELFDGVVIVENTATLNASVILQGRQPAPNPTWSVPLTVKLYEVGGVTPVYEFNVTTDDSGTFQLTGIAPGTYEIAVKNSKTLQRVETLTLNAGVNNHQFDVLLAGDANNDNFVTLADFSILTSTFNLAQGDIDYDDRADFSGNGFITLQDFSLLTGNFNVAGEAPSGFASAFGAAANTDMVASVSNLRVTGSREVPAQSNNVFAAADEVFLAFTPADVSIGMADGNFTIDVWVQSGTQVFDSAEVHIDFDPSIVEVVGLTPGSDFTAILISPTFDNAAGEIDFSAGAPLGQTLMGDKKLLTIEFSPVADGTTTLPFEAVFPRMSDVQFEGNSVLTGATSGEITVVSPNTAPVAQDDNFSTDEDTPLSVSVTANDAENDGLSFTVIDGVSNGSLNFNTADGSFTYTPNANYFGTDSFTFQANDGQADSNIATIDITVTPVNDAPVAVDDEASVNEDESVNIAVLVNDSDVDGVPAVASATQPSFGMVVIESDGTITYTPDPDYNGSDSFDYTITDGALSDTATVNITVIPVDEPNTPPSLEDIADQENTVGENASLQVQASDVDGDTLIFSAVGLPDGLTIDAQSGLISGTFEQDGVFNVTVRVGDGTNPLVSTSFTWTVNPQPTPDPTDTTEPTPDPTDTTEPTPDPTDTTEPTPDPTDTTEPTPDPTDTTEPTPDPTDTTEPTPDPTDTTEPTPDPTDTTEPTPDPTDTVNEAPTIEDIDDQTNTVGDSVSLQVQANDPEGLALRYEATNLPAGVTIDVVSGLIGGTIGEAGIFNVMVTVIDSEGQDASTSFVWTVTQEAEPTEPAPTEPAPTTPAPLPSYSLGSCYDDETSSFTLFVVNGDVAGFLGYDVYRELGIQNLGFFEANEERVIEGVQLQGENPDTLRKFVRLSESDDWAQRGGTHVLNPANANPCEDEPTPTTPAPTTPAPTTPAPTTPAPTTPAPTTPAPGLDVNPLSVCWVEDQNNATTVWRVSNPNTVTLAPGSQAKAVFGWETFSYEGSSLQSAERWDQIGQTRINTNLSYQITVTWYIFDNALSAPLGSVTAYATEDYRCQD